MRGLFTKALHEVWLTTLLIGISLMAFTALLTFILPEITTGMGGLFDEIPFVKSMVTALLGSELGGEVSARTMQAFLWVHPVVLSLVWAHEVILCTRFPSGEIDRGTIDVLLGLPVSRRAVYLCETIVWLLTGVFVVGMALLGHLTTASAIPDAVRPELPRVLWVIINLFMVYVAVGGIAFLAASLSDRRVRAMALVFGILLGSFLLNFVAQFWEPARQFAFLSVMEYYQPAQILQDQTPVRDFVVLFMVGGASWSLGGEIVARRSICTV